MFTSLRKFVKSKRDDMLWKVCSGIFVIFFLVFLFIMSDGISDKLEGATHQFEMALRSLILVITAWFITKFIKIIFLDPINSKRKKNLPNIVKDIIFGIVYFVALVIIITGVYGQTTYSILTFFISSWTIIGFAAKDVIAEFIHGLSIDFHGNFELGDWVQFKDGTIGKIVGMSMTSVDVLLPNNSLLYVSNKTLNGDSMINLSKPDRDYYVSISIALEHHVPVSKATRVLLAATLNVPEIHNYDASVFSKMLQENGVVYEVRFSVEDRDTWIQTRHEVLRSISEYLHRFNFKVCQTDGDIKIIRNIDSLNNECNLKGNEGASVLDSSELFDGLSRESKNEFTKIMKLQSFYKGDSIIAKKNLGLFIVSEGLIDLNVGPQKKLCLVDSDCVSLYDMENLEKQTTISARSDVEIFEVSREDLFNFATNYPEFEIKLKNSVTKCKLNRFTHHRK